MVKPLIKSGIEELGGGGAPKPSGTGGGGGARTSRTSGAVKELQEKYPKATAAIKQMQQNMQAASLWLTQKYAQAKQDPEAKDRKALIARFHQTQEKMNLAEATDGVWGPNTRKALEAMQNYINKYHADAGIKPLVISITAYNNFPLVQQAVESNFNSTTELLFAEGIELPGTDVTGRLARGKPLDNVPVEYAKASTALNVEDPTGISVTTSDMGSILALKTKLISGGFNTEGIEAPANQNIEFQIFLNQNTGTRAARAASIADATVEDLAAYYDSKPEFSAFGDTYFDKTANFFANTVIPSLRNRTRNADTFFKAFQFFYGRSLEDMMGEMVGGHKRDFKHTPVTNDDYLKMRSIGKEVWTMARTQLHNFFRIIDNGVSRGSDLDSASKAKAERALQMFGEDLDGDDFMKIFSEIDKSFTGLMSWSTKELEQYSQTSLMTTDKVQTIRLNLIKDPSKASSDINAFLGRKQELQEVSIQRSKLWTYGKLLAVANMVRSRANAQLNVASGGKKAFRKNDLIKESAGTAPIQYSQEKGNQAEFNSGVVDTVRSGIDSVKGWFGGEGEEAPGGEAPGEAPAGKSNIKNDPITIRIKTEYVRLANALIRQIRSVQSESVQSEIMRGLKGRQVNKETLNGIVVPDDILIGISEKQGREEGGVGGPGGRGRGSGSRGSGENGGDSFGRGSSGFGGSRSGKPAPRDLPFNKDTINLRVLAQWMQYGERYAAGWNTELASKMSRIPVSELTSGGSLYADLPSRIGGIRDANRYLIMVRKAIYTVLQILEDNAEALVREGYRENQISDQYKIGQQLISFIRYTQQRVGTTG